MGLNLRQGPQQQQTQKLGQRVNVNTDDLQKAVLDAQNEVKNESTKQQDIKPKEQSKNTIQNVISGNTQDAKKDMLKDFVQKVASSGMDILANPDKGRSSSNSELKLIFGDEVISDDEVTLSADAKMGEMKGTVKSKPKPKASTEEVSEEEAEVSEGDFKEEVFTERNDVRSQVKKLQDQQDEEEIALAEEMAGEVEVDGEDALDALDEEDDDLEIEEEGEAEEASESDNDDFALSKGSTTTEDVDDGGKIEGSEIEGDVEVEEASDTDDDDDDEEEGEEDDDSLTKGVLGKVKVKKNKKTSASSAGDMAGGSDEMEEEEEAERAAESKSVNVLDKQRENLKAQSAGLAEDMAEDIAEAEMDEGDSEEDSLDIDSDGDDDMANEIEKASGGRIKVDTESGDADGGEDGDADGQAEQKVSSKEVSEKEAPPTKQESLEKYTSDFRRHLLGGKKDYVGLQQDELKLLKEHGVTSRQIKDIQQSIKKSIKAEVREKIKDAILVKQLSALDKFDALAADTKINQFTNKFVDNLLLGGDDFGNFDDGFQGLVNKAMYSAGKELANFAVQELEEVVIKGALSGDDKDTKISTFEKLITDLNGITNNPKVTEEWAQAAMEGFMKNYGLSNEEKDLSDSDGLGLEVDVNTGDGSQQNPQQQDQERENHGYEFDDNDERSLLINRMRALYLQRALNPGLKTTLETEFKMRKMKNGLLRLGVYTDVLNDDVKKEADEIAGQRLMEIMTEALSERASMYELKGPAYDLVENKIKGVLKNLARVGQDMGKKAFDKIRDDVNRKIYDITKKEMEMIEVRLSEEDFPSLVLKYREMKKLTDRLREESNFQDEIAHNEKFSSITIVETA
jgi:hypothetical protein